MLNLNGNQRIIVSEGKALNRCTGNSTLSTIYFGFFQHTLNSDGRLYTSRIQKCVSGLVVAEVGGLLLGMKFNHKLPSCLACSDWKPQSCFGGRGKTVVNTLLVVIMVFFHITSMVSGLFPAFFTKMSDSNRSWQ